MSTDSDVVGTGAALQIREALAGLFDVHGVVTGAGGTIQLHGRLLVPPDQAYARAADRLRPMGYTPAFRRRGQDDVIQVWPRLIAPTRSRDWVAIALFGLTVLSVLYVGAGGPTDYRGLPGLRDAVPYAAAVLAILVTHELGHYLVSRHYGVPRSLPYFLPLPLPPFGTFGAVIQLKAPPTNRRVLLAIAVAGPLAGLAVALPLLAIGLKLSPVGPLPPVGLLEGNSILYAAAKYLMFGRLLPGGGLDVNLHPLAFGAWVGLFITGLNLIPAGQLDGGHIVFVLVGEKARYLSLAAAAVLAILGVLIYPGWLLMAAIILVLGRTYATPLDGITRLRGWEVALAIAMVVVFILTFVPIPLSPFGPI